MLRIFCTIIAIGFITGAFAHSKPAPNTLKVDCPSPITLIEGSKYDTTVTGVPKVTANDGGKVTISYLEVYQKGDCKNRADLVTRIFTITNAAGEQVRCNQYITIQHLTVNDIRVPADTTIDHPDSLTTLTQKLLNGFKSFGSVRISYFDTRVSQNCNIPVRIRRQWSFEDICNGQVRTATTFMNVHKYFNSFKQIISKSDAICLDEGFIQLTPVGEFTPYTYKWNTGDSTSTIFNRTPGSYTLTITDRFTCTASVVYDLLSMSQRADIGGQIKTETGIRVVPDSLVFEDESLIRKYCISRDAGLHYGFTLKSPKTGLYNYRFVKKTEAREGISTKDIVLIQRHILGLERFKDTAQNIAADVNFNYQITASDITELRRLILGVRDTFAVAKPWYFLRSDWRAVAKPNRPISEIEFKGVNVPNFPLTNVNVYVLKMGDVDFSYKGFHQNQTELRSNSADVKLRADLSKGAQVPVYLSSGFPIYGIQFNLHFSSAQLIGVEEAQLASSFFHIDGSDLKLSWSTGSELKWDPDKPLFYIHFSGTPNFELAEKIEPEAYDQNLIPHKVALEYTAFGMQKSQDAKEWFYPNPTHDEILMNVGEGPFDLKLYDLSGREVKSYKVHHAQLISLADFHTGMYKLVLYKDGKVEQSGWVQKN